MQITGSLQTNQITIKITSLKADTNITDYYIEAQIHSTGPTWMCRRHLTQCCVYFSYLLEGVFFYSVVNGTAEHRTWIVRIPPLTCLRYKIDDFTVFCSLWMCLTGPWHNTRILCVLFFRATLTNWKFYYACSDIKRLVDLSEAFDTILCVVSSLLICHEVGSWHDFFVVVLFGKCVWGIWHMADLVKTTIRCVGYWCNF